MATLTRILPYFVVILMVLSGKVVAFVLATFTGTSLS